MRTFVFRKSPSSAHLAFFAFAYLSLATAQQASAAGPPIAVNCTGAILACDEGETWSEVTCTCVAPLPQGETAGEFYKKAYVKRLADYGIAPKKQVGSTL